MSSRSQTSTTGSNVAVASRLPRGSKARLVTSPRCPGRRRRSRGFVGWTTDQMEIVPSCEPIARSWSLGEKARASTRLSTSPLKGLIRSMTLGLIGLEQSHGACAVADGQNLSIAAECQAGGPIVTSAGSSPDRGPELWPGSRLRGPRSPRHATGRTGRSSRSDHPRGES